MLTRKAVRLKSSLVIPREGVESQALDDYVVVPCRNHVIPREGVESHSGPASSLLSLRNS